MPLGSVPDEWLSPGRGPTPADTSVACCKRYSLTTEAATIRPRQKSREAPSMSTHSQQPSRESAHRWWGAVTLSTIVLAGLVGGLIGGVVVGLVGRWTGWWMPTETAGAACAVDRVAADALPSVVTIGVVGSGGAGSGSGVVYRLPSSESVIITNAQVVTPPGSGSAEDGAAATTIRLQYADGHSDSGRILGMDQVTDLAVVTAATPYPAAPPIRVGDSGSLRVGIRWSHLAPHWA